MCVHHRAGDCLGNMDAKITLKFSSFKKFKLLLKELFKKMLDFLEFDSSIFLKPSFCSDWSVVRSLEKIPFVNLAFHLSACQWWIKLEIFGKVLFQAEQLQFLALHSVVLLCHCFVSNCSLWCENSSGLSCAESLLQSYGGKRLGLQGCAINPMVYSRETLLRNSSLPKLGSFFAYCFTDFSTAKGALKHHELICRGLEYQQLAWCGAQWLPWPQPGFEGSGALLALPWSFAEVQLSLQKLVTCQY